MFIIFKTSKIFNNFSNIWRFIIVVIFFFYTNFNNIYSSEFENIKLSTYMEEDYPNKILDLFIGEWELIDTLPSKVASYKKIETFYEKWERVTDKEIIGLGYKVEQYYGKKQDTTLKESMKIVVDGTNLIYSAKTNSNKDTISFVCNKTKYIRENNKAWLQLDFLNLKHDFPNLISYNLDGKNDLYAIVKGDKSLENDFNFDKTIRIPFKKKNTKTK